MDRPLPAVSRRLNQIRATARVVVPLAALAVVIALLPGWIRPALLRARIRTAVVQAGPIESVITAAGTVMPEIERVLSSPVDARLLRLLKRPGAAVDVGEPVAELDLGESRLAVERIARDLAITDNRQDQIRLALDKALADLDARIARTGLDLEMLEARAAATNRLFDEGLASQQALADARLAVRQKNIELAQLRRERSDAQRATELQSDGLSLERAALAQEAQVARHTLDLATTRSDRTGILTWILPQEGALVRRGEVIARIADLSSFRIDASAADVHSGRIRTGLPVRVAAAGVTLPGVVAEVLPTIENSTLRFTVALGDRSHPALRPSMRVDVLVVTDHRARTLKVRQGPFSAGGDRGDVFVLRNGRAIRTAARFGLRDFEEIEVLSGLAAGDEVVISDMRDYLHLEEMEVR